MASRGRSLTPSRTAILPASFGKCDRLVPFVAVLVALLLATACSPGKDRLDIAPANTYASPDGFRGIRYWGDVPLKKLDQATALRRRQLAEASKTDPRISVRHADYLAISGGGSRGAFGAGLLAGWSKTGKRPEFEVVTGISTGSLTAPFAFLGPEYDPQLTEVYTTISDKDVMSSNGVAGALFGTSLADNAPLKTLVAKYVNADMLKRIAVENGRGRRLLIGTTNLDAGRPVVWDMTAIAASDNPAKLELFRNVLVASAAIPGVFPPEMIKVTGADGKSYDEMHVDGGATTQAFLLSAENSFKSVDAHLGLRRTRSLYVIVNGSFRPQQAKTEAATFSIIDRSLSTLIKSQMVGDVYEMYAQAIRDQVDFNIASIPDDFTETGQSEFDREYMNKLYHRGYELAGAGHVWQKIPPD
jgi:predicted acylesterase/phospholipase RssA